MGVLVTCPTLLAQGGAKWGKGGARGVLPHCPTCPTTLIGGGEVERGKAASSGHLKVGHFSGLTGGPNAPRPVSPGDASPLPGEVVR